MNKEDFIKILDSLASGLDPVSGERLPNESVLRKREVIRALQFAIDSIHENINYVSSENPLIGLADDKKSLIEKDNLTKLMEKFKSLGISPSITTMTRFFIGYDNINTGLKSLEEYGVLKNLIHKKKLQKHISKFFADNSSLIEKYSIEDEWKNIDLSLFPKLNRLKPEYIERLKKRVEELPIKVTNEKLKNNIHALELRKFHPRAYETYSVEENELLDKAFMYTNDIQLLAKIFQRNETSITAKLKKYYYSKSISSEEDK